MGVLRGRAVAVEALLADAPPVASIIIPTYREGAGLIALLEDLQSVRTLGIEIIVVDGDGADASLPALAQLCDQVIISAPGRAHQMNTGAQASEGRWLLFLHADSRGAEKCMAQWLNSGLPSTSDASGWGFFKVQIAPRQKLLDLVTWCMNLRARVTGIATGDQGLWVARALFYRVGGFPEQWLMEDVELCSMLRQQGRPTQLSGPLITSARRWQSNGLLATVLQMWWLRLRYWLGVPANTLAREYYPQRRFTTTDANSGRAGNAVVLDCEANKTAQDAFRGH